jgi:hypothetical protein
MRVAAGIAAAAILAALPASPAMATAYKWTDEQGKVHYSDSAPAARQAEKIQDTNPLAPSAPADARGRLDKIMQDQRRLQEIRAEDRDEQQEAKEKRAKEGSENAKNCVNAQSNLRTLELGVPLYTIDAAGERNYVSDESRTASIAEAKKSIAYYCGQTSKDAMSSYQRENAAAARKSHCEGLKIKLGEMTKVGADAAGSDVAATRAQIAAECRR